jgi:hypothetical protein
MGGFSPEDQKSILFLASIADNLIRNPGLHIISPPKTIASDTQSLNLEIYGRVFSSNSKKHIISCLNGRQFDTQSEIAYHFPAQNSYK